MIRRILSILIAMTMIAVSANAQNISFEVQANEAKISLTGAAEMTALQFNLHLPEGVTLDTNNARLGSATDGHTLCIETLAGGDLLFILYSMDLKPFKNGELLRLPFNGALDGDVSLYTIRTATKNAVSHMCSDVSFDLTNGDADAIEDVIASSLSEIVGVYSVSGQKLPAPQKGLNIIRMSDGTTRKVMIK